MVSQSLDMEDLVLSESLLMTRLVSGSNERTTKTSSS